MYVWNALPSTVNFTSLNVFRNSIEQIDLSSFLVCLFVIFTCVIEYVSSNCFIKRFRAAVSFHCLISILSRRRISVFGHVARLDDTPANMALQLHINASLSRPPGRTWRRPPGRPRNKWLDQIRNDSTRPIGDLWRRAVDRGHGGATT